MKYGKLKYVCPSMNLGDIIQSKGIDEIYTRMGIKSSDIIEIDRDLLSEYDGDYVVLPLSGAMGYFFGTKLKMFPLSPKIIPVFIGFHCIDEKNFEYLVQYKHFGPFGCRDEATLKMCRKYGLEAYLSGCMSLCIKKRAVIPKKKKVLLVDVNEFFKKHIPKTIMEMAEEITQMTFISEQKIEADYFAAEQNFKLAAEKLFQEYEQNVTLVITSRLHTALPCAALGIPVIFVKDTMDCRFGGVDRILKSNMYKSNQFAEVDWEPQPIDVDWVKEKQIKVAANMIKNAYNKYKDLCELSQFYEEPFDRKEVYYSGYKSSYITLKEKYDYMRKENKEELLSYILGKDISQFHLIIFGAGDKALCMCNRYHKEFAKFKSCIYVDNRKEKQGQNFGTYYNFHKVLDPSVITKYPLKNTIIIIAAEHYYCGAGKAISKELIEKYHLKEEENFFFLDKINESANLPMGNIGMVLNFWDGY